MREALAAIRTDLGQDAVMLSSRKLATGVEVIAAIDYDDSLLGATGGSAAAAFGLGPQERSPTTQPAAIAVPEAAEDAPTDETDDYEELIAARVAAARGAALREAEAARAAPAPAVGPDSECDGGTRSQGPAPLCSRRSSRASLGTT